MEKKLEFTDRAKKSDEKSLEVITKNILELLFKVVGVLDLNIILVLMIK